MQSAQPRRGIKLVATEEFSVFQVEVAVDEEDNAAKLLHVPCKLLSRPQDVFRALPLNAELSRQASLTERRDGESVSWI